MLNPTQHIVDLRKASDSSKGLQGGSTVQLA